MKAGLFWVGEHPLSAAQEMLYKKLVPPVGPAETPHGELLRSIGRVYYDVYNNGFCNWKLFRNEVELLQSKIPELASYMENPSYWGRRRSLEMVAKEVGRSEADDISELPEAIALEDLTAAVVKYVEDQDKAAGVIAA